MGGVMLKGPYGLSRCHTKRRMGARGRAHLSFVMTPNFKEYILKSRRHTKRRMGMATSAHPSFGMIPTQNIRDPFA